MRANRNVPAVRQVLAHVEKGQPPFPPLSLPLKPVDIPPCLPLPCCVSLAVYSSYQSIGIRRGEECSYVANTRTTGSVLVSVSSSASAQSPAQSESPADTALQPAPSLQQLSQEPHYNAKHLLDLRLMHYYCVFTVEHFAKTMPESVSIVLKVDIPRLALEHEFLMDAILLIAMTHMACTEEVSMGSLPVYLYRHEALRSLRQAVADISPGTIDAVLGASALLATASFAADRITQQPGLWTANWLTLVLGQRNFRPAIASHLFSPHTRRGSQYGAFADVPGPGQVPTDIQRALSRPAEHDHDNSAHHEALSQAAKELGRLIAVLERPYEGPWLEKQIKSWAWDMVPLKFPELVRGAHPHALVILAYYLAIFRLLPESWTYRGVADHDIEDIWNTIDPKWVEYMSVPKMALQMDDKSALARLLVNCLPGRM